MGGCIMHENGHAYGCSACDRAAGWRRCPDCDQPMLPPGRVKMLDEFDHAKGCQSDPGTFAAGLVWGAAIVAMAEAIQARGAEPLRFSSRRERWPDDFGPCD